MDLEILKIASNTDNNKVLDNCTHSSKLKNPICGDEMEISIRVLKDNIVDFGYQCKSCIYCQASVSLLSQNSVNKKILNVKNLLKNLEHFFEKENVIIPKEWSILNKIFNKKNISRKECILLPFKALSKALNS
tara:strand:- start:1435 stop:1833 length:399 start_codon:yes stop_codon:yes gene_type:complete